jgi:6-phosphogluconolactonase/glucosamine-6-phosphate isomerase/deaminase
VILATGEGKRGIIRAALEEDSTLPITNAARAVAAAGGDVVWALDRDAAGGLPG